MFCTYLSPSLLGVSLVRKSSWDGIVRTPKQASFSPPCTCTVRKLSSTSVSSCSPRESRSRPPRPSTAPSKLAVFLAEQAVHGERSAHKGRAPPGMTTTPPTIPDLSSLEPAAAAAAAETAKSVLDAKGPEALAAWVRQKKRVMVTDTTMRDAHQVHKRNMLGSGALRRWCLKSVLVYASLGLLCSGFVSSRAEGSGSFCCLSRLGR